MPTAAEVTKALGVVLVSSALGAAIAVGVVDKPDEAPLPPVVVVPPKVTPDERQLVRCPGKRPVYRRSQEACP
jgi:hypothetical protein